MKIGRGFNQMDKERQKEIQRLYYQRRKEIRKEIFEDFVKKIKYTKKIDRGLNVFRVSSYELTFDLIDNKIKDIELYRKDFCCDKEIKLLKREIKQIEKIANEKRI